MGPEQPMSLGHFSLTKPLPINSSALHCFEFVLQGALRAGMQRQTCLYLTPIDKNHLLFNTEFKACGWGKMSSNIGFRVWNSE